MVPDYDDDDIVEDYEEVTTDSPVRRVESAQGGPVKRPSAGVRPSTTALPALDENGEFGPPNKGKITQKSAKMIWILCIGVSVLGVGAVLVDLLIDPLGRHVKTPEVNNVAGGQDNGSRIPPRNRTVELTAHQKLARAYTLEVHKHRQGAIGTRSYDFLLLAIKRMNEAYNKASKTREEAAGYVDAWVAYYDAEYAVELFYHANGVDSDDASFTRLSDYRDNAEVEFLEDDELQDAEKQRMQGIYQAGSDQSTKIAKHRIQLKGFVVSANVLTNEELNGPILDAMAKLDAARKDKVFAQEDLDYVNRDPRGPDEPPPYVD